ncbi:hypothetical protein Syun_023341 [Stephania yunnanensis]|uniref:Uncharacterized protein n=1 Tax=Stephania yunnanensis TaxID=152371 RepID=A0AAP0FBJ0_9MAGN
MFAHCEPLGDIHLLLRLLGANPKKVGNHLDSVRPRFLRVPSKVVHFNNFARHRDLQEEADIL